MKYAEMLADLVARLSEKEAAIYAVKTDKLLWIELDLLDPLDLPRRYAERVEARLIEICEAWGIDYEGGV